MKISPTKILVLGVGTYVAWHLYQTSRVAGHLVWQLDGVGNLRVAGGKILMDARVALQNPIDASLQIDTILFTITLNGHSAGRIWMSRVDPDADAKKLYESNAQQLNIPALGQKMITVPVTISFVGLVLAIGLPAATDIMNGKPFSLKSLIPRDVGFSGRIAANGIGTEVSSTTHIFG